MAVRSLYLCAALGANLAFAQSAPRVGSVEIFGLRKVPAAKVRQALNVNEGATLPPSKGDAEERINGVDGIVESHLEAYCCEAGRMLLYVGVEERGAVHFDLRDAPEGDATLPAEVTGTHRRLMEAIQAAVRKGMSGEDLTRGYSLVSDPPARAVQEMLPALADEHLASLRQVLREANDETQRAAAVQVIGYATKKAEIVNDLQFALRDPDPGVRGNAVSALGALAVYQRLNPQAAIRISPTWFVEMLNSLSWADRNKAAGALQILTDTRDATVLAQLRDRALPSLVEMARWKLPQHALPAFLLVGRVAGWTEERIQQTWESGNREALLSAVK